MDTDTLDRTEDAPAAPAPRKGSRRRRLTACALLVGFVAVFCGRAVYDAIDSHGYGRGVVAGVRQATPDQIHLGIVAPGYKSGGGTVVEEILVDGTKTGKVFDVNSGCTLMTANPYNIARKSGAIVYFTVTDNTTRADLVFAAAKDGQILRAC